jgi:uncharacterized integral membrane protein
MLKKPGIILVMVLFAMLVIFTAQNYEVVKLQFLFWSFTASRAIVIFFTLLIGIIMGWFFIYLTKQGKTLKVCGS